MDFFSQKQQFLQDNGVILYFNGPVSQDVVEGVGEAVRSKLRHEAAGVSMMQRVFTILVEQMQNIIRYSTDRLAEDENGAETAWGQIIVGLDEEGGYFVSCGNKINSKDTQKLQKKIEHVQHMEPEELKKYYKEMRRKGPDSDSKGAGLGFIEMARKARAPLSFSIEPLDETSSFFAMKVKA
ncbi:SiaB family protein kinase [Halodesulfovibrio sp.]|uniref:SiaB family protein kinase n=1 Tax=Halodesulfovibrio sp. TaxID=1912772 RepID=UPI0025E21E3D|nr:SiaB family protein kinase [Halodesulfovibrio sp.]MCT4534181.1 SiaB family protein kinase [Halodesulfovibrio sp.]MCT4627282.1 SiaB family protein kinase [Halodesulfovibrio sp.]